MKLINLNPESKMEVVEVKDIRGVQVMGLKNKSSRFMVLYDIKNRTYNLCNRDGWLVCEDYSNLTLEGLVKVARENNEKLFMFDNFAELMRWMMEVLK